SVYVPVFFFSSRRRHTRLVSDWSSDVCSSDLFTSYHLISNLEAISSLLIELPSRMTDSNSDVRYLLVDRQISEHCNDASLCLQRSEERRVGKEWRSRGAPNQERTKSERGP